MISPKALTSFVACLALGIGAAVFIHSAASGTPAVTPDLPVTSPASGIGLFDLAASPSDGVAATQAGQVDQLLSGANAAVPDQWKPGSRTAGTARIALTSGDLSIWAYKSSSGKVCEGIAVSGVTQGAGCTGGWSSKLPVDVNTDGVGNGSRAVWGLAPDAVTAVSVVVNGVAHPALLKHNAYLYVVDAGSVNAVVADYGDGTSTRFSLEEAPNPIG